MSEVDNGITKWVFQILFLVALKIWCLPTIPTWARIRPMMELLVWQQVCFFHSRVVHVGKTAVEMLLCCWKLVDSHVLGEVVLFSLCLDKMTKNCQYILSLEHGLRRQWEALL